MADWKKLTPIADYLPRLPVAKSVLVQLKPGDIGLSSIDVRGRDSFVIRFKTGARSIWTMVPEPEWIGFLLPISWEGDYLLNGMAAEPNTVFRLDGAYEYDTVAEQRDAVTVGVRRSVLANAASSLCGREYRFDVSGPRGMIVPPQHKRRLISILWKTFAASPASVSEHVFQIIPTTVEADMVSAIADWVVQSDDHDINYLGASSSDLQIVRDAIDAMLLAGHPKLSIADLCRASGVKKSRLHQAFSEVHGISPGDYLYRARLTSAREYLLEANKAAASIKSIAIQHGFLSSGQFARAYRSMFGELPSDTIAG